MTPEEAQLLAQFQQALDGATTDDLREIMRGLDQRMWDLPRRALREERRRPRLDGTFVFRVRVDLDHARPPIWRRLDLRSDLTLDQVHRVLQAAFGWWDYHLHRFALGGHPFDWHSQLFLCPAEVEEGEEEGVATADVRLDEVIQQPGDALRYAYDYGDSWDLTLKLEKVLPAGEDEPPAVCIAGRRAAPPEDCGGLTDAADLATVLEDPAHFDPDEVNEELALQAAPIPAYALHPGLAQMAVRLQHTPSGKDFAQRLQRIATVPVDAAPTEYAAALAAHQWFLDRAPDGGIPLTAAGYLKPADVEAAALVVPGAASWIGKKNREDLTAPVLNFRQSLQAVGLLREHRGRLLLTKAGAKARRDPELLWLHLRDRLIPTKEGFDRDATLLLLAYAADSAGQEMPIAAVATALEDLGWRAQRAAACHGPSMTRLRWRSWLGCPRRRTVVTSAMSSAPPLPRSPGTRSPSGRGLTHHDPTSRRISASSSGRTMIGLPIWGALNISRSRTMRRA